MKSFFKFCIPKILFLLLVTNTGIRPVAPFAIVPVIAAEELAVLVGTGTFAIGLAFAQFMSNKDNNKHNEPLSVNMPGESVPIQIVTVAGKSDDQVVAELTQAVTRGLSKQNNLSEADQKELYKGLCLQKSTFINTMTDNRSWGRTEGEQKVIALRSPSGTIGSTQSDNREKGRLLDNQVANEAALRTYIAYHPKNREKTERKLLYVIKMVVNVNHPDRVQRIIARIYLSHLVNLDPATFGDEIKEFVKILQVYYFDKKGRLIHVCDDKHLAETMNKFLLKFPFCWGKESFKQHLFDLVKKESLDPVGCFDRMDRKRKSQLSEKEMRRNKEYEARTLGKFWRWWYKNIHKKISNERYNRELIKVAVLSRDGDFEGARAIAKRFNEDPMMVHVINDYQQELCNYFGILKIYEHLPPWKQLPLSEKRAFVLNVALQNQMNKRFRAEFIRLQTKAIALAKTGLKAADKPAWKEVELKAEAKSKQKIVAAPDLQSAGQPILGSASPEDPNKDKKQKQDSEQAKKKERAVPPEGENKHIKQDAQKEHNWGKREGHVERTPENEKLMYDVANDPNCYLGPDDYGNHWYAKREVGKQAWVKVRNNRIISWGINEPGNIRIYNSKTGLAALKAPSQKILKIPSEV